ncbi:hypothetical protein V1477_010435 [Vespula maculifrons]|uniref:Uncharacterized protein n=1 Tax=Vespula maculifrons TaxID=7453 RepID=A0ABD2C9D9_VESMC
MVQSCYDFRRVHIAIFIVHILQKIKLWRWGYFPTREANKMNFDSCWFSLVLNFNKYTSQFSQYYSIRFVWGYSPTRDDNISGPTATVSDLLRISTSTHCSFCSTHSLEIIEKSQCKIKLWSGDTGLRETTTNSSVRPILTVNGSVLLRISTSTHRNFHSTHSPEN